MQTTPQTDLQHTIVTAVITVCGLGTVIFLAWHGDIHDGETVSAIAAVLGIQIGSFAFRKVPPNPPDDSSGGQ